MDELVVRRFDDVAWSEGPAGDSPERIERARAGGYRRKALLAGEGDVYLTYVEMGPGWTVHPHSHTAKEIIHVLDGSLTPAGADAPVEAGGSLVVGADVVYGFTCGPAGVKFLIYRQSDAAIKFVG